MGNIEELKREKVEKEKALCELLTRFPNTPESAVEFREKEIRVLRQFPIIRIAWCNMESKRSGTLRHSMPHRIKLWEGGNET